jgi:hypothetical protein
MSRFEETATELVELVGAGATFQEACRSLAVAVNTGRSWLRKGRSDPDGRYGAFATAIDAARAEQVVATDDGPLTPGEWEVSVARAVRAGSVPAMKLWFETREPAPEARVDPFDEFDELAARRRGHA